MVVIRIKDVILVHQNDLVLNAYKVSCVCLKSDVERHSSIFCVAVSQLILEEG